MYSIFQSISKGYDRANTRISLGLHLRWKKKAVRLMAADLPQGGKVLDLCCGTGDISTILLQAREDLHVTGADFSPNMLSVAKSRFQNEERIELLLADARNLPFEDNSFDGCIISFGLRNTADYKEVLAEIARVTRPGGIFCCLDSFCPTEGLISPFYHLYFSFLMPLLGGGAKHRKEYQWLYQSTRAFVTPDGLRELMRETGFKPNTELSFLFGSCVCQSGYSHY